jgi:hypothetical protein
MNWRCLAAVTAAALFTSFAAAQACPRERAQNVPADTRTGPPTACTSIDYTLAGVRVTGAGGVCPTFVVYTPKHQDAVPTDAETRVDTAGIVPVTLITFACERDYFLWLIPLSGSCQLKDTRQIATVMLLTTTSCTAPSKS